MGTWVALVLIASSGPAVLETRYFETAAECEAWARRVSTPLSALRPDTSHQVAASLSGISRNSSHDLPCVGSEIRLLPDLYQAFTDTL